MCLQRLSKHLSLRTRLIKCNPVHHPAHREKQIDGGPMEKPSQLICSDRWSYTLQVQLQLFPDFMENAASPASWLPSRQQHEFEQCMSRRCSEHVLVHSATQIPTSASTCVSNSFMLSGGTLVPKHVGYSISWKEWQLLGTTLCAPVHLQSPSVSIPNRILEGT